MPTISANFLQSFPKMTLDSKLNGHAFSHTYQDFHNLDGLAHLDSLRQRYPGESRSK